MNSQKSWSFFLHIYLSIHVSFYLIIFLFIYLSIHVSFYLTIFLYICLSIFKVQDRLKNEILTYVRKVSHFPFISTIYTCIFLSDYLSICIILCEYLSIFREQDRLKNEMLTKVETVAAEFRKVAHSQMAATTQRTIR